MRKILMALCFVAVAGLAAQAADPAYHLVKEIPIGGPGGWDYITVDSAAHRIYVSHATKVVVADTETGKVIGEIPDTPGVHGFAVAADLGLGFTSNGRDNSSTVVDLKTLKALNKVMTGGNPDAILYEPVHHEVYTFNGSGQSATVFAAKAGTVIATIPLMGKPEAAVFDRAVNRIYVNIEDKGEIAVIDVVKHAVVATWPLKGCEDPTGLGFDEKNHRLFSSCGNQVMVATDSRTGQVLATTPIGRGADGAAFDPGPGYALASNGEGTMSVQKFDGKTFTLVETVKTQASARTMILDAKTHTVYLPAATMVAPAGGGRAQAQPDSFKVLVFGLK
jgi:DNA-binding beta-propeller fold protein YncE